MQLAYKIILLTILNVTQVNAAALNVEDIIREGKSSTVLSDHFKALRLYNFLKDTRPKTFYSKGLIPYLETQAVLMSFGGLEKECDRLAKVLRKNELDTLYYTCGRLFFDSFQLSLSEKYLNKVSGKNTISPQHLIYKASLYMGNAESEKCLKILNASIPKRIKNSNIRDLFYLTRARCFVQQNEIDRAILEYHMISASSPFYYYALEESAWTQFKVRHFESVRTLLDVIVTTYETGLGERRTVPAAIYFRSRYLMAYTALVQKNSKLAQEHFQSLKDSVNKYASDKIIEDQKAQKMAQQIALESSKWLDTKAMPREIQSFLEIVQEWADARLKKRIDKLIEQQFALSREIQRFKENKIADFDEYQKNLISLEKLNRKQLEDEFVRAARSVERSIRVIKIKSDLGSLELVWTDRAQGMRSISELLDNYQEQINEVEDFF